MQKNRISSRAMLIAGSLLGVSAFSWPLFLPETRFFLFQPDAARALAILVSVTAIAIVSLDISRGVLDSKAVALLGVLAALIAALRLVGAGAVGIEPMWFLLIIASYVFGTHFGFALGVIAMGISALITGGVGPWLPFQMLAAGWIGLFAGSISVLNNRMKIRHERLSLVLVGVVSSLLFGLLMDLQLWPWIAGTDTQLSFIPGAAIVENLQRFVIFHLATALAWDIPRAITTSILVAFTAKPLLHSLRRSQLRMNFTLRVMAPAATSQ